MAERVGRLIVLSGPSGSGKSTVWARALAPRDPLVRLAVSATTRQPRSGERDGVHYHFWTPEQFEQGIKDHAFLEWAEVYGKHKYGTLKSEVDPYLAQGTSVLLEIDVQGALQVRKQRPDCVMVFLRASSLEEYERRLRARHTESEEAMQRRLNAARTELDASAQYDYQVINDNLDEAVRNFSAILQEVAGVGQDSNPDKTTPGGAQRAG